MEAAVSAATKLLDRLPRVKQLRPNEFISGCPAHGSKQGRPVHITVLEGDRLLLNPFCGCPTEDVLTSIGLSFSDLYPERLSGGGYEPLHSRISARDLLEVVDHEIAVAVFILNDIITHRKVGADQVDRLIQAAARIGVARDTVNPRRVRHAA